MRTAKRAFRAGRPTVCVAAALAMLCMCGCEEPEVVSQRPGDANWNSGTDRPASPRTLLSAARILAAKGQDRDAESVLGRIVREYPDFVPAYVELAELYMRQRRIDQAIGVLCRGTTRAPNDPVLRNDLGMCWLLKNDYAKAFCQFQAAAGVDPDDARYRANMALALGMMGRYDEALALYRQVVTELEAHENLAIIGEARKDPSFAAEQWALVQSIGVDPEDAGRP